MADIYINYGTDLQNMTFALMEKAEIANHLKPSMKVVIKPNLVVARPADGGATTHPEIVEGIIRYLQHCGVRDITIAEGSWVGDSTKRAFAACGYRDLEKQYGVTLVDTKSDRARAVTASGMKLELCESILAADYLINVPVLKGHCQTDMTCCLKNMKGCIPDAEKRRYHTMGLHKPIAALAAALKPDLHIIDSVCGDLTFEEGGNPVVSNRVLLGFDGLLLDSYCAGLMGYRPDEIAYLKIARETGVGEYAGDSTQVVELNPEGRPKTAAQPSRIAKGYASQIAEDSACSACYAALVFALHKLGGNPLEEKIKIGQGYRGKAELGFGVGNCTAGCERYVQGCPPKASDIVDALTGGR